MQFNGETKVAGVFGDPVAHSLSPPMHNRAFEALGLNWVYVPFHVKPDRLKAAVEGVRAMKLVGVNVTVPHKIHVMEYLDEIDDEAALIGAVNTIVHQDGRLKGYNTDGRGFIRSLVQETGRRVEGARVVILGAGGAAQAIACSLALSGATSVAIANRTLEKAEALCRRIEAHAKCRPVPLDPDDPEFTRSLGEAQIVIQTTTVGMHPHHDVPPPAPVASINPEALVCDIVYNPRETSLLRAAKERGCGILTGEGMLAYQGAIAFELWTGEPAPGELMLDTLRKALEERA